MAEEFLIRTNGGPKPGTRVVPEDVYPWPLPEVLAIPGEPGYYKKKSESQLPPMPADSRVLRGAEYEWIEP
jgi:hypothetical protein